MCIGNDLEDRLKALEIENASLKKFNLEDRLKALEKYNEYHQVVHKIDHMIQQLNKKRPKLSNLNQTQNRGRYVNFENGSHFICSFNLNNLESTVCIVFRMNGIASGNYLFLNGIIGNKNGESYAEHIAFYKTHSGLGLAISTAYNGLYLVVANDDSSLIRPDYRFPTQKVKLHHNE